MSNLTTSFLFAALVIFLLFNIYQFTEIQKLKNQVSTQNEEIYFLKENLEETSNKLIVALTASYYLANAIQEAKNFTWGTYEDMGYALEALPE